MEAGGWTTDKAKQAAADRHRYGTADVTSRPAQQLPHSTEKQTKVGLSVCGVNAHPVPESLSGQIQ